MPIGVSNSNIGFDPATKKVTMKPPGTGALPNTGVLGSLYFNNNNSARAGLGNIIKQAGVGTTNTAARGALQAQFQAQPPKQQAFNLDPNSDPVYQRALTQAKSNAQSASGDAMAALNKRGILDSTITSDRVAGIQQDAVSNVDANLLPQLSQQAFQRYQDAENQKSQADQLAIQQGQLTGYYQSPEMQKQYAAVTQAKQDYANAKTPEERIAAHQRAEAARGVLEKMNANAGLVGSDVTLDQANANANKFGVQTQAAKEFDTNMTYNQGRDKVADNQWAKTFDLNNTQTMAALTGYLPNGTPTNAKQQQDLDNLWTAAGQTGKIPDILADMYGLPHGTPTQSAYQFAANYERGAYESDRNYSRGALESDRNYALAQDDNDLAWIKADNDMSQPGKTQTVSPAAAGQILSQSLSKTVGNDNGKPVYGTITDPVKREQAFLNTWNTSGVASGPDTVEMLSKAGYTADEITKYQKKYPQAFQPVAQ